MVFLNSKFNGHAEEARQNLYGKKVYVYPNTKQHTWSVKDVKEKRVVGTAKHLHLVDVKFHFNRRLQQEYKQHGYVNRHWWITGTLVDFSDSVNDKRLMNDMQPLLYDPAVGDDVVRLPEKEHVVTQASYVYLTVASALGLSTWRQPFWWMYQLKEGN